MDRFDARGSNGAPPAAARPGVEAGRRTDRVRPDDAGNEATVRPGRDRVGLRENREAGDHQRPDDREGFARSLEAVPARHLRATSTAPAG
ncbi:hypothetical protein [Sphingomonas panni]|uniref:hypothetical protein n=1 Tax=Sphingomonas panni TaxID=237612 RepID=UPI001F5B1AA7|nr:hypothetical protein [Sphingomonas panni]